MPVDGADTDGGFVGFGKQLCRPCGLQSLRVEVLAEREEEVLTEQLLGKESVSAEAVDDPRDVGADGFFMSYQFVPRLYAVDDERFAQLLCQGCLPGKCFLLEGGRNACKAVEPCLADGNHPVVLGCLLKTDELSVHGFTIMYIPRMDAYGTPLPGDGVLLVSSHYYIEYCHAVLSGGYGVVGMYVVAGHSYQGTGS